MVCTYCSGKTSVTNSRLQKKINNVWRRRLCNDCGALFSTQEHVDHEKTWVVQYFDGSFKPFQRDKLFLSIYKSCQHRSSALPDAQALTATAISRINPHIQSGSIDVHKLTSEVHAIMIRFDTSAATHYKAFHSTTIERPRK